MNQNSTQATEPRAKSHFLRNFLIVFLSALLVFGLVLGTVVLVKNSRTYMRYGGISVDRATFSYLASYYKFEHMRALAGVEGAEDTEAFWSSVDKESKKTQGQLLAEGTKNYISMVLVRAALFDTAVSAAQKKEAKEAAKNAARDILTFRADGDVDTFDKIAAPYGYSYADLEKIALLLYKSQAAQALYYGDSGENTTTRLSECNDYLEKNYDAVHLFFIRTDNTFVTTEDENGNKVIKTEANGSYELRPLIPEEETQRAELMQLLDNAIATKNLTLEFFKEKMKSYYADFPEGLSLLYYFSEGTDYTERFCAQNGTEILSAAQQLKNGDCIKLPYEHGYCYVYKTHVEENAFTVSDYQHYFSDFYENAADDLFAADVAVLMENVVVAERTKEISPTEIPYKEIIPVRFD